MIIDGAAADTLMKLQAEHDEHEQRFKEALQSRDMPFQAKHAVAREYEAASDRLDGFARGHVGSYTDH